MHNPRKSWLQNPFVQWLLPPCTGFAVGILSFCIAFAISTYINPPVYTDPETGQQEHVMAMGQFFIALIIAFITGIATAIFVNHKLRIKKE
ncbi:MAG: hypothetical protein JST26_19785 [Bacteroidetes bacterium]|nr:hypothetical protein [Bacteroidota bacterium]